MLLNNIMVADKQYYSTYGLPISTLFFLSISIHNIIYIILHIIFKYFIIITSVISLVITVPTVQFKEVWVTAVYSYYS